MVIPARDRSRGKKVNHGNATASAANLTSWTVKKAVRGASAASILKVYLQGAAARQRARAQHQTRSLQVAVGFFTERSSLMVIGACRFLILSARRRVYYSDIDLWVERDGTTASFKTKDGTPYSPARKLRERQVPVHFDI
jgi:hypothetical protein